MFVCKNAARSYAGLIVVAPLGQFRERDRPGCLVRRRAEQFVSNDALDETSSAARETRALPSPFASEHAREFFPVSRPRPLMGSTGHWPVPSGDSPDGMGAAIRKRKPVVAL